MYFRNSAWSRLEWPSSSKKGDTPSSREKTLNSSHLFKASTSISDVILPDSCHLIMAGIYLPLKWHTGAPGIYFPGP